MQNIKVDFVNTYLFGGAAHASLQLYMNLQDNTTLQLRYFYRHATNHDIVADPEKGSGFERADPVAQHSGSFIGKRLQGLKARKYFAEINKALEGRPEGLEQFSVPYQFYKSPYASLGSLPDVVHLHWIAEWIDYPSFFDSIPDTLPVVWTLHDMNAFTAGCHYSWSCRQYEQQCNDCFQLGPIGKTNLERKSWKMKANALKHKNLHIVADSTWLETCARKSALLENAQSFQTIHYSLDTEQFAPGDRMRNRIKHGVDTEKFTICFGAASLANKRKGGEFIMALLKKLQSSGLDVQCLVFGGGGEMNPDEYGIIQFGQVRDKRLLAEIYSMADVFILPSLEEAFGQTAIESMACGTPVIAFDSGGISDSVIPGRTGWLVPKGDVDKMMDVIARLAHGEADTAIPEGLREHVTTHFSALKERTAYLQLYKTVTNENT